MSEAHTPTRAGAKKKRKEWRSRKAGVAALAFSVEKVYDSVYPELQKKAARTDTHQERKQAREGVS